MSGAELELVREAFESNWIAPLGPHVDAFEREMAEVVGVRHGTALSSGTAALHLALKLVGVGRGDEVLVSGLTFSASANAVTYEGAAPVFVDSELRSWNLDPDLLAEELERAAKTGRLPKAVVAVDLYGQCCDYDRIEPLCARFGVPLVEDAAEALGATCAGRPAGSFGRLAVLSFNGNKIITTSGGGMLVSGDEGAVRKARFWATQARDSAPHYQHSEIGFNYRMSNIAAAIGRGQLRVLGERVAARRRNFEWYVELLGDLPGVEFMPEAPWGRCTRWLTCLTIEPEAFGVTREDVRLALEEENIESRPVWKPMHLQPVFAGCRAVGGSVGERLFRLGLCLPSGSSLTRLDVERVAAGVRRCCRALVSCGPRGRHPPPPAPRVEEET
jgi:pyridoxal phosphate-dependent aminotransferase EpsN